LVAPISWLTRKSPLGALCARTGRLIDDLSPLQGPGNAIVFSNCPAISVESFG
jgi:hypothetical protein